MNKMTKDGFKLLFEQVTQFSLQGGAGITRLAYSKEDQMAHQCMMIEAEKQGLKVRQDAIGNIFIHLLGSDRNRRAY